MGGQVRDENPVFVSFPDSGAQQGKGEGPGNDLQPLRQLHPDQDEGGGGGGGHHGQLGNGSTSTPSTPTTVNLGGPAVAVSLGGYHMLSVAHVISGQDTQLVATRVSAR